MDDPAFRSQLQAALGASYELGERVGSGGFADVFAARDLRLKREVAVKVLRSDLVSSSGGLDRFQREAEAIAQLRHPNIIPIYDVGETDGLAYFVMPLVKGESLATMLHREERLSVEEAGRILRDVASALHEAHEAGMVHRDIKPENIMLEGKNRRVLVMDFGIAKAVESEGEGLTMTGMIVGTPQYMSPEQASGDRSIDHRTDQYALAVVGYRMLTGNLPFDATTARQVIYKTVVETATPVDEVRPEVPGLLSDALERAMAKDPDERYGSMEEFSAAVAPAVPGTTPAEPSLAAWVEEPETVDSGEPAIGRRVAALGVVALLAFVLLYGVAFHPTIGAPQIPREEAVSIARQVLVDAGAVPFEEAVRFRRFLGVRRFLQRTLGMAEARRWVEEEPLVGHWYVRWFVPQEPEDWRVYVAGNGTVTVIQHTIDNEAPGADLDPEAARAVADSILLARGWELDELELLESQSESRPNRTDHLFQFEKRGSTIAWKDGDAEAGTASVCVYVRVLGDRIGLYTHFLGVPEDFTRELGSGMGEILRDVFTPLFLFALGAGPLIVLGIAATRGRAKVIRWMPALSLSGFWLVLYLVEGLNGWPATKIGYSPGRSLPGFFTNSLFGSLGLAFLGAFAVCVLAAAGDYLGRQSATRSVSGFVDVCRRKLTPAVIRAGIAGCALGIIIMGYNAVFWAAARSLPGVSQYLCSGRGQLGCVGVSALTYGSDNWGHYSPDHYLPFLAGFVEAAFWGILMGAVVFFWVALCKHYLKSTWAAILIPAVAFGALGPWVYPTYLGSLGSVVALMIFALSVVRFGVVACIIAVYFSECVFAATVMLGSGESGLIIHGILLLICALLPASLGLIARRRGMPVPPLIGTIPAT